MKNNTQYNQANYATLGNTAEHHNNKKLVIFTICGLIAAVIAFIVIVAIVMLNNNSNDNDDKYSYSERPNTSLLQAYATLKNEMTFGDLEQTIKNFDNNAALVIEDDGTGYFQSSDGKDYIAFYYDMMENEDGAMEETIINDVQDDTSSNVRPDSGTIAYDIRYVYMMDDDNDAPLYIGYSEDDEVYNVYDITDIFEFQTRQEAIEAYLAPVISQ